MTDRAVSPSAFVGGPADGQVEAVVFPEGHLRVWVEGDGVHLYRLTDGVYLHKGRLTHEAASCLAARLREHE